MARVVLVEDNPHLRALMAEVLALDEHAVLAFESSVQALASVTSAEAPDLLVADYHTSPSLSGYELAKQLRERFPTMAILVVSGTHEGPVPDGRYHVLRKPFSAMELLEAVRTARAGDPNR